MPEGGDDGVDGGVRYMTVDQYLDQSPEEPRLALLTKASPKLLTYVLFKFVQLSLPMIVHLCSG
jgi:hypothetical protein